MLAWAEHQYCKIGQGNHGAMLIYWSSLARKHNICAQSANIPTATFGCVIIEARKVWYFVHMGRKVLWPLYGDHKFENGLQYMMIFNCVQYGRKCHIN